MHLRHLIERHLPAIVIHRHVIKHVHVRAPGSHPSHRLAEIFDGFVHARLELNSNLSKRPAISHVSAPLNVRIKTSNYKPAKTNAKASTTKYHEEDQTWISFVILRALRGSSFFVAKPYALTVDPIFSPSSTRRILPCWFRLKTMMGRLLSLHRLMAVESITFRPNFSTSM